MSFLNLAFEYLYAFYAISLKVQTPVACIIKLL
jgi:hypothetical protein